MSTDLGAAPRQDLADRLRALSQRCRAVSEWTSVPEVTRELVDIADDLLDEAKRAEKH